MPRQIRTLRSAFGAVLADLRHKADVSQEAFAARCGLHRTYVSQLERGLKSPTLDTIVALATALGIRADQLVRAAAERAG